MIGIDPTVDFVCKRLLGSPDRPAMTLHFLNSFLRFTSPIREVRILNPTIEKEFEEDKWSLLDILATDDKGASLQHRNPDEPTERATKTVDLLCRVAVGGPTGNWR
jgi:hypothetical protein